jgi:colanic acid biosynthesis glycosyl transferase WcaI
MRILVVEPHYSPDGGTGAALITNLCEELASRGHLVTMLSAVPHYPSGRVPKAFRGKLKMQTIENGVHVIRVALPSLNRKNLIARMLQFVLYQIGATIVGLRLNYDVYLTSTAALQVWLPFVFLSVLRGRPAVYSVADVYPDIGIKLGIFRHKIIIELVRGLERFCLNHAVKVRTLSESFSPALRSLGVPRSKICLIYDWVDIDLIKPLPRDNDFAVENNLVDQFVVLYAGNLGHIQGLEYVLEAAKLLQDDRDIYFIFVGDGSAQGALIEKADQLRLSNVKFFTYQPFEKMPKIFAAADVSLVTLLKGTGFSALPSKSYAIFASGRPLLASIDEGCELWDLIKRANAGLCLPPENPARLAEAIRQLKQDNNLSKQLGRNGRIWAEQNHSPQSAAKKFEKVFASTIKGKYY